MVIPPADHLAGSIEDEFDTPIQSAGVEQKRPEDELIGRRFLRGILLPYLAGFDHLAEQSEFNHDF